MLSDALVAGIRRNSFTLCLLVEASHAYGHRIATFSIVLIEAQAPKTQRRISGGILFAAVAIVSLAAAAFFVASHWPFTRDGVTHALESSSAQTVQIGTFRRLYFPPGAIAEQVRFLHH